MFLLTQHGGSKTKQLFGERQNRLVQGLGLMQAVYQSPVQRGARVDRVAGHEQPACARVADQARQQRGVDDGRNAHMHFGHAIARVKPAQAKVTGGGDFKPGAQAPAGNACNDRNAQCAQGVAKFLESGDEDLRRGRRQDRHFVDVGATDEGLFPRAAQD